MNLLAHRLQQGAAVGGALAVLCALSGPAGADPVRPGGRADEAPPPEMVGVEVVEKLGASLPLHLTFDDETGAPIELASLFGDGKPVILTFNYSNCTVLCSVQLGNLVHTLGKMKESAGVEFRIITVGLNPMEGHKRAMATKLRYLERYERPTADEGWRFLTGTEASIRTLARAIGFGYRLDPKTGDYLHPAALILGQPCRQGLDLRLRRRVRRRRAGRAAGRGPARDPDRGDQEVPAGLLPLRGEEGRRGQRRAR